jgi:hypothetical protein
MVTQEGERLGGGSEAANIEAGTPQKIERVFAHEQFILDHQHEPTILSQSHLVTQVAILAAAAGSSAAAAWFARRHRSL